MYISHATTVPDLQHSSVKQQV